MVKTRTIAFILCAASLAGCGLSNRSERAHPRELVLARGRLGRTVSLVRTAQALVAVYSDMETTCLDAVEIPLSDALPAQAPAPEMIDRIALIPPLPQSFGEHTAYARGNDISVKRCPAPFRCYRPFQRLHRLNRLHRRRNRWKQ